MRDVRCVCVLDGGYAACAGGGVLLELHSPKPGAPETRRGQVLPPPPQTQHSIAVPPVPLSAGGGIDGGVGDGIGGRVGGGGG